MGYVELNLDIEVVSYEDAFENEYEDISYDELLDNEFEYGFDDFGSDMY